MAISIHAPREGGDRVCNFVENGARISIHAPREGGDRVGARIAGQFQNFNPRPPRGGRPALHDVRLSYGHFNPRPPRGGRLVLRRDQVAAAKFQSTPPARGATGGILGGVYIYDTISIHAPREGGDQSLQLCGERRKNFNPRPPRGGRHCTYRADGRPR